MSDSQQNDPAELPIDGVLDLHAFRPADTEAVVLAYIEACQEKGIRDVRIIHGKGIGTLRRQVHQLLDRHAAVKSYSTATDRGGWGATVVKLVR